MTPNQRAVIVFRILSFITLFFVMIKGDFISMPYGIVWLSDFFIWGTFTQLFAILAMLGVFLLIKIYTEEKKKYSLLLEISAFILLVGPLTYRLCTIPIQLFYYLELIIPIYFSIVFYTAGLFLSYRPKASLVEKNDKEELPNPA